MREVAQLFCTIVLRNYQSPDFIYLNEENFVFRSLQQLAMSRELRETKNRIPRHTLWWYLAMVERNEAAAHGSPETRRSSVRRLPRRGKSLRIPAWFFAASGHNKITGAGEYNELNFCRNDPRRVPWKGSDRYPCTRSYNKFKANEDTQRRGWALLSGYVWISHGIFHARIQSPWLVLKVCKSRPLKYVAALAATR